MPRGIPNAKRDDAGMRFTSFHVPLPLNPKQLGTSYLRTEAQTLWARNAARNKSKVPEDLVAPAVEGRRGSKVLIIHPGSRWLRIGRASDVKPTSVPNVIARKHTPPIPPPAFIENISRPQKGKGLVIVTPPQNGDEYTVPIPTDDPVEKKIASIAISLRDRMRFYKLRVTANAASIASSFNEQFKPEIIADYNDSDRVDWVFKAPEKDALVSDEVAKLSDPWALGYTVKWPIYSSKFNMRDYSSLRALVNDIEFIWKTTLLEKLGIEKNSYKDYSVVLIVPDLWDRTYVRELVNLLLVDMGFKQVCAQQESLAATYGAGVSNACVIDIGATKTSVACVDDGLVIPDTRMSLNMGGDDITEFLYVLLDKISFPYKDINLSRSYDWDLMEDLKRRLCTLNESEVALNLYDFIVRRPGNSTEKYGLRAYDEVILAPMCIFEPRVIEFDKKRLRLKPASHPDVSDEVLEYVTDRLTNAMLISTQHLMPQASESAPAAASPSGSAPANGQSGPEFPQAEPAFSVAPQPAQGGPPPQMSNFSGSKTAKFISMDASDFIAPEEGAEQAVTGEAGVTGPTEPTISVSAEGGDATAEVIDVDMDGDVKPTLPIDSRPQSPAPINQSQTQSSVPQQSEIVAVPQQSAANPASAAGSASSFPGNLPIDVCFEASKLPLDVAIFNSARAAGGDEKIRKYLQAVLVVGGTALVPGMAHALESRLQAIATPLVPNMEKVQIIAPPKDVDPRVLAWKGAAVLGKMDGITDLWVTAADWEILGMRGLKERCYFL